MSSTIDATNAMTPANLAALAGPGAVTDAQGVPAELTDLTTKLENPEDSRGFLAKHWKALVGGTIGAVSLGLLAFRGKAATEFAGQVGKEAKAAGGKAKTFRAFFARLFKGAGVEGKEADYVAKATKAAGSELASLRKAQDKVTSLARQVEDKERLLAQADKADRPAIAKDLKELRKTLREAKVDEAKAEKAWNASKAEPKTSKGEPTSKSKESGKKSGKGTATLEKMRTKMESATRACLEKSRELNGLAAEKEMAVASGKSPRAIRSIEGKFARATRELEGLEKTRIEATRALAAETQASRAEQAEKLREKLARLEGPAGGA